MDPAGAHSILQTPDGCLTPLQNFLATPMVIWLRNRYIQDYNNNIFTSVLHIIPVLVMGMQILDLQS